MLRRDRLTLLRSRIAMLLIAALVLVLASSSCGKQAGDKAPEVTSPPEEPVKILVLAASDLRTTLSEFVPAYEKQTGTKVSVSYGSTGQLAKQIENGAKADLFLAANKEVVDGLVKKKLVRPESVAVYAFGRLALWSTAEDGPRSLAALKDKRYRKIAIANPEHAPYGVAAVQALRDAGIYDEVASRLVMGENASQALQFVRSENAEVGIVPLSLVKDETGGTLAPIPASAHKPIEQTLGVVSSATYSSVAARFGEYLTGREGRSYLHKWGFGLPKLPEPPVEPDSPFSDAPAAPSH